MPFGLWPYKLQERQTIQGPKGHGDLSRLYFARYINPFLCKGEDYARQQKI